MFQQMKGLWVYLSVLFFVSFPGHVTAEQSAAAVIESITYEKDEDNHEKIVFKLNGAHIPKVFKIKGERPRLVFDFIDTRYSDLINRITDTKGNLIKGVRVGIHDDPPKTRVVVDLKAEEEYQFEQDFLVQENILSITFYPRETDAARKQAARRPTPEAVPDEAATGTLPVVRVPVEPELPADAEKRSDTEQAETAAEKSVSPAPAELERPVDVVQQPADTTPTDDIGSLLAGVESQPEPAVAPFLRDVSFDATTDNSEMVLFKLNDFYPPIVFGIEKGDPRVVCDFLDTELNRGIGSVINTNGSYVHRIRIAKHENPHKVRVVLDLVPNRNYDLQQVFFKEDNLFVIVINEFEDEPAATPPAVDVQSLR